LHFTPTSSSWLNMVEIFFSELTMKRIRRGVFRSVKEFKKAIMDYIKRHNNDCKKFVWAKNADTILGEVMKCKEALGTIHYQITDIAEIGRSGSEFSFIICAAGWAPLSTILLCCKIELRELTPI
jgi:hypothetical protein